MREPLVSIIVTTHNNQATLEDCLFSITNQDYKNRELIVVDNVSTDGTVKIAKTFTKLVFNKGPERSAQRNYAVSKTKGDYILIIDSDMVLPPTVVDECVKAITKKTQSAIIPEQSFGKGFWAQCKALERSFYNGVDAIEAPRFFSKAVYQQAGGYDEHMAGGEDWDLGYRVRKLTSIARTTSPIMHNEGNPTLKTIVSKRRYYTKGFKSYYAKANIKTYSTSTAKQVINVYLLFLKHPLKLIKNPFVGIGMLYMKTLEFGTLALSSLGSKTA
jgi:glycosyltransferase involved in cell wall biosynthesis